MGIFNKIFGKKKPITKPATMTTSTPVLAHAQTPLVSLESVKSVLESNSILHQEYSTWSDEKVVDKLIQLLKEEPKKKLRHDPGAATMPKWLAKKYHIDLEQQKKDHLVSQIRSGLMSIFKALGDCKSPKAVKPLSQILNSSEKYVDEYLVTAGAEALGKIGGLSAIDELKPLLRHGEKRVSVQAAISLARLNQPEGMEALRRVMNEREEWKKELGLVPRHFYEIKCAKTLYELGDKSGMNMLIEYLGHPSFMAEALTFSALEKLAAPESREAIKEYISREREGVKEYLSREKTKKSTSEKTRNVLTSAHILAKLGDLSEVHHITEILSAGGDYERQHAAEICHQLGFTIFMEPLRKRLETEGDQEVRTAIEQAIHRIENDPVDTMGASVEEIPLTKQEEKPVPRIESPREWAQKLKENKDYRALAATITDRAYDPRVEAQRQKRLHAIDALEEAGSEAVDSILDVAGADMGALAGEDLAELLVKIGDPKAVPFLKKMLDRDEFYSSTKGKVEGFVSRYPELHGAAEMAICSLCGKSRPVNEFRHVNPDYYFCRDTCWNRRGKIVGSKNVGALGCPFYSEGMCTVDGGNTCSLSFGSYNTTCYVYRIGTTRRF